MECDKTESPTHYNELMSICANFCDVLDSLYRLKTKDGNKLAAIYKDIKIHLIDSNNCPPYIIITLLSCMTLYNNRYIKSYLTLAKQIFDEYHPKEMQNICYVFNYLFYQEYGIILNESDKRYFKECESQNYSVEIHKENTIYRAIMDNDKELLISIIGRCEFDKDQRLISDLYPDSMDGYSFLELCCYYGSVDCFKFFITMFHSEITQKCLRLSFLGGNQEILSECLKFQQPDDMCMKYAIFSHNIDFVSFLMNEYNIEINFDTCIQCQYLQPLLVYLDQTNDINTCFIRSGSFFLPSVCKYFISHGVDINAKNKSGRTSLHYAAINNSKETAEVIISHGADINAKGEIEKTPLHYAAIINNKETAEVLISHGADINAKCYFELTPLHYAAENNSKETAEILISHGADINAKNISGQTPLHYAAENNSKETAEILISHGADINAKNKSGQTPLHYAAINNSKETAEVIISHGADINAKGEIEKTPLHYAAIINNKETAAC